MKLNKELIYNIILLILLFFLDEAKDLIMRWLHNYSSSKIFAIESLVFLTTISISYVTIYMLNYLVFAPRYLTLKTIWQYVLSFVVMVMCFAAVRFFLEEILTPYLFGFSNYNLNRKYIVFIYLADSFVYTINPVLFSSLMYLFFRYTENKSRIHKLEIEHQEAKLSMLRSQISPHFLFNTLNGFYSDLYDEKPETAKDVLKLSQLLRYVTYEVKQNFMPLNKEIDFIKDYLYFYKKRYEDDFYVNLNIDGHVSQQPIPSLILIHFIENVCKHGIINDAEKPAEILIKISENLIEVTTQNYINASEKYMEKGIGTENIKKRLEVLFKDNFTLNYNYNGSQFKAYLKMPFKKELA